MKTMLLPVLILAGCASGNPFDTSEETAAMEESQARRSALILSREAHPPQTEPVAFRVPDLEGWRMTVWGNADSGSRARMRQECVGQIARLEGRQKELDSLDPIVTRSKHDHLRWALAVERERLAIMDAR